MIREHQPEQVDMSADLGPFSVVVVDMGNTQTHIARWVDDVIHDRGAADTSDADTVRALLAEVRGKCRNQQRQALVLCSVVPDALDRLVRHIEEDLDLRAFVVGGNTPLPIEVSVDQPERVGVDRVCAAAAAFERIQQPCVIIDAGSAVTVDLVDGNGVFQGGAILPGAAWQARSLAEWSAQLPLVEPDAATRAIGKDTAGSISAGIAVGLAGAVRGVVEAIADECGVWPQTVLTGGGARLLHERLDFVDNWVPDLCLLGVGLAYYKRAEAMLGG
jgi:type III pantothenate kinase